MKLTEEQILIAIKLKELLVRLNALKINEDLIIKVNQDKYCKSNFAEQIDNLRRKVLDIDIEDSKVVIEYLKDEIWDLENEFRLFYTGIKDAKINIYDSHKDKLRKYLHRQLIFIEKNIEQNLVDQSAKESYLEKIKILKTIYNNLDYLDKEVPKLNNVLKTEKFFVYNI